MEDELIPEKIITISYGVPFLTPCLKRIPSPNGANLVARIYGLCLLVLRPIVTNVLRTTIFVRLLSNCSWIASVKRVVLVVPLSTAELATTVRMRGQSADDLTTSRDEDGIKTTAERLSLRLSVFN